MIKLQKTIYTSILTLTMSIGVSSAQAAFINYTITGDVLLGDEFDWNAFDLTAGDTITVTGMFDDSVISSGSGTIFFNSGSGNTMTLNVGTKIFTASNDEGFLTDSPSITLSNFDLIGFDYLATSGINSAPATFSSSHPYFDDIDNMIGQWQTTVEFSPVPVPAAVWLFGSGLIGLVGFARRKKA